MSDFPALIHFYEGWADAHQVSEDGFPTFKTTVMIQIERPPLLKLNREANREDFAIYRDEYDAFKKTIRARDPNVAEKGYPLVYWPALSPADVETFAARGVYTVEALAARADDSTLPGDLLTLALRAEQMLGMQQTFGKHEALLREREAELAEMVGQVKEMRTTISAQNALIETLKMRVA